MRRTYIEAESLAHQAFSDVAFMPLDGMWVFGLTFKARYSRIESPGAS